MKWYYFIPYIGAILFMVQGEAKDTIKIMFYQIVIHVVIFTLWQIFFKGQFIGGDRI